MATGVTTQERSTPDTLLASCARQEAHPLPSSMDDVVLSYPNKLPETEVLKFLSAEFAQVNRDQTIVDARFIEANSLILSDNLYALHNIIKSGQKATLIYLDPPYATGMDFQSRGQGHAYTDKRSSAAYLEFMRRRLILMREVLANDGSIYVHIGHQMVCHLKVIMDEVFGQKNFRNIITRRKCSSKNFTSNQYSNLNDYILFYSKGSSYKWNKPGERPTEDWLDKEYPKVDQRGKYKLVPIHAPGTRQGESGKEWKGMLPPPGKHWQYLPSKLDQLDANGEIHWSKTGNPRRKVYLEADKQVSFTDYWDKFRDAHHQSIAITGYPTEKNFDMLKMIVSASSDAGDLIIDPFCGSGTTLHAADILGRNWIGIDQSYEALKASLTRLRHGLAPMGDYVSTKPKMLMPTLFSSEFKFIVDKLDAESVAPTLASI